MKAGRELDALIAEKVMGHPYRYSHWKGVFTMKGKVPHYSTQIQDAWLVVDAKEWELQMVVHKSGKHAGKTGAILSFDLFMEERDGILADTAPLAICLAALKAVGHED